MITNVLQSKTYHTSSVLTTACFFGRLNNLSCNDSAVRAGNLVLLELAWNALADQMSQAQADFGDLDGWNRRVDVLVSMMRENYGEVSITNKEQLT